MRAGISFPISRRVRGWISIRLPFPLNLLLLLYVLAVIIVAFVLELAAGIIILAARGVRGAWRKAME